ncbi:MAG: hypothetical protein FJW31_15645 [Acidobacteria bacterium]|nr:hypothetical protein [Acidobacteriota bacterium]
MNPFRVWKQPVAMAEQALGLAGLSVIFYWWLGVAETSMGQFVVSALGFLVLLAGVWWLVRRGRARVAAEAPAGGTGERIGALILLGLCAFAAYHLVWWVPGVEGMRGQLASMVARFGAALLLVVTGWANLLGASPPAPAAETAA